MKSSSTYNTTILNNLFTSREFDFIDNIEADINKINTMKKKEDTNSQIITSLINTLNDINNKNISKDLLQQAKEIQALINDNIRILQINKQTYDGIKQSIIDLLIKVETEKSITTQSDFSIDMINLRNTINTFYDSIEKENLQLSLNKTKIDNFFMKPILKEYLSFDFYDEPLPDTDTKNIGTVEKITQDLTKDDLKNALIDGVKENNSVLLVSEKEKKVFLPYTKKEVLAYIEQFPTHYKSFTDVVKQEFILPLDFFIKFPVVARFREAYSLIRDRESKSVLEAIKFAVNIMFHYDLNPVIIAACKSQEQLENYLTCIEHKCINQFKDFEILFELTPIS